MTAAHQLERADLGVPLDVDGLDVPRAASALLRLAGWREGGLTQCD